MKTNNPLPINHRLASYAYTDAGIAFGQKLWEETVDLAVGLDARARDGIM